MEFIATKYLKHHLNSIQNSFDMKIYILMIDLEFENANHTTPDKAAMFPIISSLT